jgi:hypothetical protein
VLHEDAPFVKRFVVAGGKRAIHPLAAPTINRHEPGLDHLPVIPGDPQSRDATPDLFQVPSDVAHRNIKIGWSCCLFLKTSGHCRKSIPPNLVGQFRQGLPSDIGVARERETLSSLSKMGIFTLEKRAPYCWPDQAQDRSKLFDARADQMHIFRTIIGRTFDTAHRILDQSVDNPQQPRTQRLLSAK